MSVRLSNTITKCLAPASLLCVLSAWLVVTQYAKLINPLFLPSPIKVIESVRQLANNGLVFDIAATLGRVMVAFALAIFIALPLAMLMSGNKNLRQLIIPYIDFIRYIPVPVLIPLTILFFGIGEQAKIILLFIGTFFQVVLLFVADLAKVPQEYFDLAYTLNFTAWERIKMTLLTACPAMYDNTRVSLGLCWSYVVIVELVASDRGLGHLIKEAQRFSRTSDIYVGILIMGLIGFLSDYAFRKSYFHFFPYLK